MSTEAAKAFAERLQVALRRSAKPIETAAELALQFNLRHPHEPITPQAAQKWLKGLARPRLDKTATLAAWLNVSPNWLHYGTKGEHQPPRPEQPQPVDAESLTDAELALLGRYRVLTQRQRELVASLVEEFSDAAVIWPEHDA